jgi:hypothetical protein
VDVSVLLQDAATGDMAADARVVVGVMRAGEPDTPARYPATQEAATNKLFRAAQFTLPEAGRWQVEVAVEGPAGSASSRFEVEAAEPLPGWLGMAGWVGWPVVPIFLFVVHQIVVRRRAGPAARRTH